MLVVPKWVENFAQNQTNLKYISKGCKIFVKLELCQIWSHWGILEQDKKYFYWENSPPFSADVKPALNKKQFNLI